MPFFFFFWTSKFWNRKKWFFYSYNLNPSNPTLHNFGYFNGTSRSGFVSSHLLVLDSEKSELVKRACVFLTLIENFLVLFSLLTLDAVQNLYSSFLVNRIYTLVLLVYSACFFWKISLDWLLNYEFDRINLNEILLPKWISYVTVWHADNFLHIIFKF